MDENNVSRRDFGKLLAGAGVAGLACGALASCAAGSAAIKTTPPKFKPIKLFCADLNWNWKNGKMLHSRPSDWATIDAKEYFDWHIEMGNNVVFCQAYNWGGYAHYPSKLGPVGEGNSGTLLPKLYEMAHKAKMPFWSYFTVSSCSIEMDKYADSQKGIDGFYLEPAGRYTDVLCQRIREYMTMYPATDWILFDMYAYGTPAIHNTCKLPAGNIWTQKAFKDIFGRPLPEDTSKVSPEETLIYKREVLARQFYKIKDSVKTINPKTKLIFNVPFYYAAEPLWVGHPMLNESEGLFSESAKEDVLEWLLKIRKPQQRVMTTILGHDNPEWSQADSWQKWYQRGCDFFGYIWGTAPDWHPTSWQVKDLGIVKEAFHSMR